MKHYACLAAMFMATGIWSQNVLRGKVLDEQGLPFQYIQLSIVQTGSTVFTDREGGYKFENLPKGTHALAVDYRYDIQYFTVPVTTEDSTFLIVLKRRMEFDEVLISTYQSKLSAYPNAAHLNAGRIEAMESEKDFPYALKRISGVQLLSDAGNGVGYTGIRLRGMDPAHVQINLNGVPFNDSESSLSYFVDIPDILAYTEDLTIIKGNVPGRSGSPSFGGAIDLNTNKIQFDPSIRIKTQFGSFNSWKYSLVANSGLLDHGASVEMGLSRQQSDGYVDRSGSDLKSFRISGSLVKSKYSARLNYWHGSEKTGQAWFGLPVAYASMDSLRTYNLSGMSRPGEPFPETDNYSQDHAQFFYQRQLGPKTTLNQIVNYTYGKGYFENYLAGQTLSDYEIASPLGDVADLTRRKWLQNHFLFFNSSLIYALTQKLSLTPVVTYSHYTGHQFGDVSGVELAEFSRLRNRYYKNRGLKKEFSAGLKTAYAIGRRWELNLDLQYRYLDYRIHGTLAKEDSVSLARSYSFFSPKGFAMYRIGPKTQLAASLGWMYREPFRADLIERPDALLPERLVDAELGILTTLGSWELKANTYAMFYSDQLAASGLLNDVGEPLRINLPESYRCGLELEVQFDWGSRIKIWHASNWSRNVIPEFVESIPAYDAPDPFHYETVNRGKTVIANSPDILMQSGVEWVLYHKPGKGLKATIGLDHGWVSEAYLDNSMLATSLLEGYQTFDGKLDLEMKAFGRSKLRCWLAVYNLLDEAYSSHGWISRFISGVTVEPSPYAVDEGPGQYAYKAVYPQALRHFNLGLSLDLR